MSDDLKVKNRDMIIDISLDIKEIKQDIFFIKNAIKVLSDKISIIQPKEKKIEEDYVSTGWRFGIW